MVEMKIVWVVIVNVLLLVNIGTDQVHASCIGGKVKKLFVFGDSYADTGNINTLQGKSWRSPYGSTFPGKPTGRWSDGRVLTDFVAKMLGLKAPITYRWRKMGPKPRRHGMNFAYGGTGVFDTLVFLPNMTTQIDMLEQMINKGVYSVKDLQTSMALVSLVGNDYTTYQAHNGTMQGIQGFITSVINQLAVDLKRMNRIGLKKIAVTSLPPLGCLPFMAAAHSFKACNETVNVAAMFHNSLLKQVVDNMTRDDKNSTVLIIDLFNSFLSFLHTSHDGPGSYPLRPCCMPNSGEYSCGDQDVKGNKVYTLCSKPESAFFWDLVHPTNMGWTAVSPSFRASIKRINS